MIFNNIYIKTFGRSLLVVGSLVFLFSNPAAAQRTSLSDLKTQIQDLQSRIDAMDVEPPVIQHNAPSVTEQDQITIDFTITDNQELSHYGPQGDPAPENNQMIYLPPGLTSAPHQITRTLNLGLNFFMFFAADRSGNTTSTVVQIERSAGSGGGGDPAYVDVIVLLDKSGSMADSSKWDAVKTGLANFFIDPTYADVSVGLNFFPSDAAGSEEQCDNTLYNPLQTGLGTLQSNAVNLINAMNNAAPGGMSPMHPALDGTLAYAMARQDANSDRKVIVVLITDGNPSQCDTNIANIAALASSAFNASGVPTHVLALDGSDINQMNLIAAAGGTGQAVDMSASIQVQSALEAIISNLNF